MSRELRRLQREAADATNKERATSSFMPTLEEIEVARNFINAGWSQDERRRRRGMRVSEGVEIRMVREWDGS